MAQLKNGKGQLTVPGRVEWVAAVVGQATRLGFPSTTAYLEALVTADFSRSGRTPPARKLFDKYAPFLRPHERVTAR